MTGSAGIEREEAQGWLREGLRTQARVIGALVLRETRTRFGRTKLGYFWAIAEPVGYVAVLSFAFSLLSHQAPYGPSMPLFFASGILPFMLFTHLTRTIATALQANEALMYFPIVKPIDTFVARGLLEVATMVAVMLITFTGIILLSDLPAPRDPGRMAGAIAALALLGFGMGTLNAVLVRLFDFWRQIYDVVTRPLMLLTGVFFVPDSLPPGIRDVLGYLPTLQAIELFRSGLYDSYRSSVLDPGYLFGSALLLTLIGLSAERAYRMRGE